MTLLGGYIGSGKVIEIKITRTDIALARRLGKAYDRAVKRGISGMYSLSESCPVAIAVRRSIPCDMVAVFGSHVLCESDLDWQPWSASLFPRFDGKKKRRFLLDAAGAKIVNDYDNSLTAKPATIRLEEVRASRG